MEHGKGTVESQRDERDLVAAVVAGDRSAFHELFRSYRDRVFNLALVNLGDRTVAEDVVQAVFLSIYRALPGFRFASSLSTWIYRITLNECAARRRSRRGDSVPLEALLGSGDEADPAIAPDDLFEREQRRDILHRALLDLSPKLRTVVSLRYIDELSYDEIAVVVGCSPGTVASRLHRGLSELERRLRVVKRFL